VVVDGRTAFSGTIPAGQTKSFEGTNLIRVQLGSGTLAELTVNGHDIGAPGQPNQPYAASFQPQDFRRQPSPGGTSG
jgi:hypothetical protein